jgi:hypothetical protein
VLLHPMCENKALPVPFLNSLESGYLRGGCLMFLIVVVILIGGLLWGAASTYQGLYLMTSPAARDLGPLPSTSERVAFNRKFEVLALSKTAKTQVRVNASDLNSWLLTDPVNRDLVNHLRFKFEHDWLIADVSIPLQWMRQLPNVPGFRDRFFNGKIAAQLHAEHGILEVDHFDVTGNGHRLPWLFTNQSYRDSLSEGIQNALKTRLKNGTSFLNHLGSIKIENNELVAEITND